MASPLVLQEQQKIWEYLRHVRAYALYLHLGRGSQTELGALQNALSGRDVSFETSLYNARAREYGLPALPADPKRAWSRPQLETLRKQAEQGLRAAAQNAVPESFLKQDPALFTAFTDWHRRQMVVHAEMLAYSTAKDITRKLGEFSSRSDTVVVPVGQYAVDSRATGDNPELSRLSKEYMEWMDLAIQHGARGANRNTFVIGDLPRRRMAIAEEVEEQFGPRNDPFAQYMHTQRRPPSPPRPSSPPARTTPQPPAPPPGVTASLPYLLPANAATQPTLSGLQADLANQLRQQPPPPPPPPPPPVPKPSSKGKGKRVDFSNAPARMEDDPHLARMERTGRIVGTEATQASNLQRAALTKEKRSVTRATKREAKRAAERDPELEIIPRTEYRRQIRALTGLYPMQAEPERDFLGDADVRRDLRNTGRADLYNTYYEALMRELVALAKSSTRTSQQALRALEAQRHRQGLPVLLEQYRSRDIDRLLQHPHIRDHFRTQYPDYYVALVRAYGTLDPALWLRLFDREATNLAFELQGATVEEAVGVTPAQLVQSLLDRDTNNNSYRGPQPMGTTVLNHEMAWKLFRTHLQEGLGLPSKRSIAFGAQRVDWNNAFISHDFYDTLQRPESLQAFHRQLLVETGQNADILGDIKDGPALTPPMASMVNADTPPERTLEPLLSTNYANPGVRPQAAAAPPPDTEAAKQAEAQAQWDRVAQGMHTLDLPEPYSAAMAQAILRPEAASTVQRQGNSIIDQNEYLMAEHLRYMRRLDDYILAHWKEAAAAVQAGEKQYEWALVHGAFDNPTLAAFSNNIRDLLENQREALLWMGGTLGPAAQWAASPGGPGTQFLQQHQVWKRYRPVYKRLVATLQAEQQMLRIGSDDLEELLPILEGSNEAYFAENRTLYRAYRTLLEGKIDPSEFYVPGKYRELKGEGVPEDTAVQPAVLPADPDVATSSNAPPPIIVPAPSPGAASVSSATDSWPADWPDQPGDGGLFGQAAQQVEGEGPVPPPQTAGALVRFETSPRPESAAHVRGGGGDEFWDADAEDRDADAESVGSVESADRPPVRAPVVLRPPSYYESEAEFTGRAHRPGRFQPYVPPAPIATRTRTKTRAAVAASLGQPPPIPRPTTDLEEGEVLTGRALRDTRARARLARRIEREKNTEVAKLQARIDALQKTLADQAAQHATRMQDLDAQAQEVRALDEMDEDNGAPAALSGQNGALVLVQQQQQNQVVQYNQAVQQIQSQIAQAANEQILVNQQAEARLRHAFRQAVLRSDLAMDADFVQVIDPEAAASIRSFRGANRNALVNPLVPAIQGPQAGALVVQGEGAGALAALPQGVPPGAHRPIDPGLFFNPASNSPQLTTQAEQFLYNQYRQGMGLAPLPYWAFGRAQAPPPVNPPQQGLPAPGPILQLPAPPKPVAPRAAAKPAPSAPVAGIPAPPLRGPGPLPAPPPQLIQAVRVPPEPPVVPYRHVARAAAGAVQEELHSMLQRHRVNPGRARSALANLLRQSYIDAGVHRPANRFRDRMVPFNF